MKSKFNLRSIYALILALMTLPAVSAATPATNQNKSDMTAEKNVNVAVKTTLGDFVVELYNDTPKHRDNFVKLVNEGYYNGLLFHRVIRDFMVQTGDPDSRNAKPGQMLGSGAPGYEIDAEIICPTHINRRGALAAARTGDNVNPERRSSGSQFYVVTGRRFSDGQIDQMEQQANHARGQEIFNRLVKENRDTIMSLRRARETEKLNALQQKLNEQTLAELKANPFKYSDAQREIYRTQGGAPHLDGAYTVFGEVVSGMETIDAIEKVETGEADRPVKDVKIISMEIVK